MIHVTIYQNTNDRKKIKKTLGAALAGPLECVLKESSSIVNPVILIRTTDLVGALTLANYAFIPEFSRYYFIDDIIATPGQAVELRLTCDVLKTYASVLLSNKFEIARSETLYDDYYIDTEKALQNRKTVYYHILGHITQNTTGKKYAITVAGG